MYIIRRPVVHLSMMVDSLHKAQTNNTTTHTTYTQYVPQMRTCTQPQQVLLYQLPQENLTTAYPSMGACSHPPIIRSPSLPLAQPAASKP